MKEEPKSTLTISCFQCGDELVCGAVNDDASCWCDALPNIMPLNEEATSCYCRTCLEKVLEEKGITNRK